MERADDPKQARGGSSGLFPRDARGQHPWFGLAAVLVIGVLLSLQAWHFEAQRADRALRQELEDEANGRALSLERTVAVTIETVDALVAFDAASERVTREEFSTFASQLIRRHPGVQALEWIPLVRDADRASHEATGRAERVSGYEIRERTHDGFLIRAERRAEYCPVFFVEPMQGNETALGFDLCSEPERGRAVSEARRTNALTMTGPIRLVFQSGDPSPSVLFVTPAYRRGPSTELRTGPGGEATYAGSYAGAAQLSEVVRAARGRGHDAPFAMAIFDRAAPHGRQVLFEDEAAREEMGTTLIDRTYRYATALSVGGRSWEVVFWPTHIYLASRKSSAPWFVLAGCLMTTLGLVGYLAMRNRVEARLRYAAYHDALTTLPNRALFIARLAQLQRASQAGKGVPYAVLFIDLDRFKLINDSLGHRIGDDLLVAVAARLRSSLRASDMVARMGGDEFSVLLPGVVDPAEARVHARRIDASLREPFPTPGGLAITTCSIGIAIHHGDAVERDLLRESDIAMYSAKTAGRAQVVVFDESMRTAAVHRQQLEQDLRGALDSGQVEVVYQPIIDLKDGHLAGFEALARWNDPAKGSIAPERFIALAEETGLIAQLGEQVLSRALDQAYAWHEWRRERGMPALGMQVNVSSRQLASTESLHELERLLRTHPLPAQAVTLELTESILLEDLGHVIEFLVGVRGRGVRVCIDDFGTGYSSLSYLHRLPVDSLKIDRSFVRGMGMGRDMRLVQTILLLARHLEIKVTAEGVERAAQLTSLKQLGCDYAQGFYLCPPLTAADATQLIESGRDSLPNRGSWELEAPEVPS